MREQDPEYTTSEAAAFVGVTPQHMTNMRHFKQGPAYSKYKNGRVKYRESALKEWMEPRIVEHEDRVKAERKRQGTA